MDAPVLADQHGHIHQLRADTGCSLEDLPGAMDDEDEWPERERESQGNPCRQQDLKIMIRIHTSCIEKNAQTCPSS